VYVIFGNSRQLSIGPEAMISILVGTDVAQVVQLHGKTPSDTEAMLGVVCALTFLVGAITFLLGIFRFGFLDSILSKYAALSQLLPLMV
jgi:MFS superfamily sulfate permease-like transporter